MFNRLKNDILINQQLLNELLSNPLYSDILTTKPFKRLKNISFLGAIDYKHSNKKRFYRYEHSINVALLGLYYAKLNNFSKKETDYLVATALLHDIGHPPLSHSTEFGFKEKYGISHHKNGNDIILGKHMIYKDNIKNILNKYDLDEIIVVKILDKKIDNKISFALNNPINIDTIDGITRTYLTKNYRQRYKMGFVYSPYEVVKALVKKDEKVLNNFWELKNSMYKYFIHHKENLYIDSLVKDYIIRNNCQDEEFALDDKSFFKSNESLKNTIINHKKENINKKLKYKKRNYCIEKIFLSNYGDIYKKYKVNKENGEVEYKNIKVRFKEYCLWNLNI